MKSNETSNIGNISKIDRNILRILQKDGRISYTDLAREVGLSVTPCIERVKRLEKNGYIKGYTAKLNPELLDVGLVVFVQIRLNHTSQENFEEFRHSVMSLQNVQSCFLVSGNYDYLYKSQSCRYERLQRASGQQYSQDYPPFKESTSYVVMEELKETMDVPIAYALRKLLKTVILPHAVVDSIAQLTYSTRPQK